MVPVIPHPDRERTHVPMFMSVTFQMAISLDEEVELSPYPTQNHSGISLSPESFCTFVVEKQTKEYEPNESDTHIYPSIIVDLL